MTTFAAPASTPGSKAPDPSRHVNYALGMVLGVDDFNQEFAYLAGRDRWLARDAIGYGTLSGLRVLLDSDANGPRLTVTSGSALTPKGQLVCVKPSQCARLNDWLAAHKNDVPPLLGGASSGTIDLYLTLCYRDCPVDLVPIPGSPCRSEDELMAPSRVVDDFALELRTTAPDQVEEDLVRDFVAGVRKLTFGGGGPYLSVANFKNALSNIVTTSFASPVTSPVASPIASPIASPPNAEVHLDFSTLAGVRLDPALRADYYRAAFLVWIEEIRPKVHALCGCGGGCCGGNAGDAPKPDECLLLARIEVPVVQSAGNWFVDDTDSVIVDESRRPILLHLRMLQELLTGGVSAAGSQATLVAAGSVSVNGNVAPVIGNLTVAFRGTNTIRLQFDGYAQPTGAHTYAVSALPQVGTIPNPSVQLDSFAANGILMRVTNGGANVADDDLKKTLFSVQVQRIG